MCLQLLLLLLRQQQAHQAQGLLTNPASVDGLVKALNGSLGAKVRQWETWCVTARLSTWCMSHHGREMQLADLMHARAPCVPADWESLERRCRKCRVRVNSCINADLSAPAGATDSS